MIGNNYLLWENDSFMIKAPFNPHTPYAEGPHLIVAPKRDVASAWEDVNSLQKDSESLPWLARLWWITFCTVV